MITQYNTAAECDFLPCVACPYTSSMKYAVATFGLEDFSTGIVSRFYHKTHGWVMYYVSESGDSYYRAYPALSLEWGGFMAHDDFLNACKDMVHGSFINGDIGPVLVSKYNMILDFS